MHEYIPILIVGIGQLVFHLFRTWHINSIAANSPVKVFMACMFYQITVIVTYAFGIDAFLNQQWTVVSAFVLGGAIGSTTIPYINNKFFNHD